MANFLEVYNSLELIENKGRKIICSGINIKNNKKVIIKLYKESDYYQNDFIKLKNNIKLCRENKNNNVINVYSVGTATYNNSKYYTVELEYIEGKSLKQLREIKTFEEIEALEIISQIINELKVLEIENIEFKNVNTESILLDINGSIKLDLSEDILSIEEKNSIKNNDSQVYLLGSILYELITKEEYDSDKEEINKEIVGAGLYRILEKCLNQDLISKYNNIDEISSDLDINKLISYEDEEIEIEENDIDKKKKSNAIKAVCICVIAVSMYTGGSLATIPIDELLGNNKSNSTKVVATTVDYNKVSKAENDTKDNNNEDDNKLDVSSLVSDLSTEDDSKSNKNESTTNSSSNKNNSSSNKSNISNNKNNSSSNKNNSSSNKNNSSSNNSNVTQKPSQNQNQSGSSSSEQKPQTTPEQVPEVKPEVTPGTSPEQEPEATPEQVPEAKPEQKPETSPEVTPEQTPQVPSEESSETIQEQAPQATPETRLDQNPQELVENSI